MEKLLQDIVSAYWWVSVVIVGIIINVISAYIKPFLENRLARVSDYWRKRQKARVERFNRQVSALSTNNNLRSIYALREIRYRIRSVSFLAMTSLLFAIATFAQSLGFFFGTITAAFIGAIALLVSLDDHSAAVQVKTLVEASIEGIEELHP